MTKSRAYQIANRLLIDHLRSLDLSRVPVDIESVARMHGVTSIEPRRLKVEGYLGCLPDDRLVIRFKLGSSPERQRFTIAHEVGHIIIARIQGRTIRGPIARATERDDGEERLANRIAAELLMPEQALSAALADQQVGWNTIARLSRRFCVSRSSLIRRLRELPSLLAIDIMISLADEKAFDASSFRIAYSENRTLRFIRPPEAEIGAP